MLGIIKSIFGLRETKKTKWYCAVFPGKSAFPISVYSETPFSIKTRTGSSFKKKWTKKRGSNWRYFTNEEDALKFLIKKNTVAENRSWGQREKYRRINRELINRLENLSKSRNVKKRSAKS